MSKWNFNYILQLHALCVIHLAANVSWR